MSNMEAIINNNGITGLWFHDWKDGRPNNCGKVRRRRKSGDYVCELYDMDNGGVIDIMVLTPADAVWCMFFEAAYDLRMAINMHNGGVA